MAFSEGVKLIAKQRSAFRCCICHEPIVEVHHILPEAEGGPEALENAAPLCARCHDLYGGNPEKGKTIRQMRDQWWKLMEARNERLTSHPHLARFAKIDVNPHVEGDLSSHSVLIYH